MTKSKQKSKPRPEVVHAADRLHSAAIHLLRRARRQDVESGIGPAQLSALSVLVFGGEMTLGQLAAAEQVKPPTMTRIFKGLQRTGLARLEVDLEDARRVRVSATQKGVRLLQAAREKRIDVLARLLASLEEDELSTVVDAVELIEHAMKKSE